MQLAPQEPIPNEAPLEVDIVDIDDGYVLVGGGQREEGDQEEEQGEAGGGEAGGGEAEGRGEESEGEASENREGEDELRDVSARGYRFSDSEVKQKLGPRVALVHSYQQKSEEWSTLIEQQYKQLFVLRSDINGLLVGFKHRLGFQEETKLSVCFRQLRELVGRDHTLKFNEEALKIDIDPQADEDAVEAVSKFNWMLEKCRELQEKLHTSKSLMECNIGALERGRIQTTATLDAIERGKKQLELVEEWATHVRFIIQDTKSSSKALGPKLVTGSITRACV